MNRTVLQQLSRMRRSEARTLLDAGLYAGAYYLTGYSVECALKACVAKNTRRYDFPDKALATKCHTHSLETLVAVAGLEKQLRADIAANPILENNWLVVKDWSETRRYDGAVTRLVARDLYSACTSRTHGVLPWIRRRW